MKTRKEKKRRVSKITRLTIDNFKCFQHHEQSFDSLITLIEGKNNSGKTTIIQALSLWSFALSRWRTGRGAKIVQKKSRSQQIPGQPLVRRDFTPLPVPHFSMLWNECATHWRKSDRDKNGKKKAGRLRPVLIRVEGKTDKNLAWGLTVEFRYRGPELIYANPIDYNDLKDDSILPHIIHCPAFSGISVEEPRFEQGYRNLRIGENRLGDILRNLLLDVSRDQHAWDALSEDIQSLFGILVGAPVYNPNLPSIASRYMENEVLYDLSMGGSGFHQTLLLLASVYGCCVRGNDVILADAAGAWLDPHLRKKVFERLHTLAEKYNMQMIFSKT